MESEKLENTIYGCFAEQARKAPDKTAIICLGERYRYGKLHEMVLKFAAALHANGVAEGDRVILYMHNLPQTLIAYLALHRLNAIPVPVAPIYTSYDLKYFVNDLHVETIICMDSNLSYAAEVFPETGLKRIIVTNIIDLVPWWKKATAHGFQLVPKGKIPAGKEFFSFLSLLKNGRPDQLPPFQPKGGDQTALILYTGGTTGEPKGVPLTVGLFIAQVREWRKYSEPIVPPGEMVTALAAPLYHVIGQMDGLTPLLIDGGTIILFPRVDMDALMDHVQRYRATHMYAVPALYRMILEHDRLDQYDLRSLKYCGCGGDVLPKAVAEWWHARFNIHLYQGYGTTESCGAISASYVRDGVPPEGSIGKVLHLNKIKLLDPETLEPVPPGEPGDLLVAAQYGTKNYWDKPEETARSFLPIDGDIWYRTNDIIRMDEQGWLYFMDRTVDIIKHKGYRIAAAEIEKVLQEHPAVTASCVIGVPDEKTGERIKAFVVVRDDVKGVNATEMKTWCRERLAAYKIPHYIEFRDMLPKSKVGKMLRREIRQEELKKR
jgi:long-chain acyl-CoA synthetase